MGVHCVGVPLQLLGHTLVGRVVHSTVLVEYASSLEIPLASEGRPPQALTLFKGVMFIAWCLRPPFRGMPMGPEAFLGLQYMSGLRDL